MPFFVVLKSRHNEIKLNRPPGSAMSMQNNSAAAAAKSSLFVAIISTSVLFLLGNVANGSEGPSADRTAEQMLQVLGGRNAWAELKNTVNSSQQNRVSEPTDVYAVISIDFEKPRFRIETTARDIHLIRVIDGDKSWRLRRSGAIEDVPQDLFNDEQRWYGAHLYRTIHRIAARDPAISLGLDDQGRLEVFAEGERILWFRLDAKSEPYAFGSYDDEVGTILGPWDFEKDGIRHPMWVSSPDGTWRAAVKTLSVNVPLHDHIFLRPD